MLRLNFHATLFEISVSQTFLRLPIEEPWCRDVIQSIAVGSNIVQPYTVLFLLNTSQMGYTLFTGFQQE